ncbi:MAG: phosphoglycerate kinase [Fibrobacterota bacterium]
MDKLFIEDIDVAGKKVIVRVDFNVPLNSKQEITDDKRIVASLPTIKYLVEQNAKVILMSHLGRPKGEKTPEFSLRPVAEVLPKYVDAKVSFVEENRGPKAAEAAAALAPGEILLLENLRFDKGEKGNDPEFAKELASLADVYVNDAFGTAHRAHASTEGITKYFDQPACGYLLKKEIEFLGNTVNEPARPFVAIIGGAKVSSKIGVIEALLPKVDKLIIGGGMAYTFYKAQGLEIGNSICEDDKVELARKLLDTAGTKIYLPEDTVITSKLDFANLSVADTAMVNADMIPANKEGCDIGPRSIKTFSKIVKEAKTVIWNGPMGVFEIDETAKGTFAVADALVEATDDGAVTIIGGGDSAAAIAKAGLSDRVSHVSTGGGASLEFLEGKKLPGVEALADK